MLAVLCEAHWRCAVSCVGTVCVGGRGILLESAALECVVVGGKTRYQTLVFESCEVLVVDVVSGVCVCGCDGGRWVRGGSRSKDFFKAGAWTTGVRLRRFLSECRHTQPSFTIYQELVTHGWQTLDTPNSW